MFPGPGSSREFAAQDGGDVGLDDQLRVEVVPAVEIEVLVRGPGEAVPAGMGAAPERVDGVPERQPGGLRRPVQRALAQHLMEGDSLELRRADTTDETGPFEARQSSVVRIHSLTRPPHTPSRTCVLFAVNRSFGIVVDRTERTRGATNTSASPSVHPQAAEGPVARPVRSSYSARHTDLRWGVR